MVMVMVMMMTIAACAIVTTRYAMDITDVTHMLWHYWCESNQSYHECSLHCN